MDIREEEDGQQKELFEFKPPKKRMSLRLSGIFPKPDFEGKVSITLTLEKMVFISIAIIMLMIMVYAFGVERGKTFVPSQGQVFVKAAIAGQAFPAVQNTQARTMAQTSILNTAPVPGVKTRPSAVAAPYTIVAATFTHKDTASQEMNRFKSEGLDAFMVQSGNFFQVCVGQFTGRDNAKKTLFQVKKRFKDAYVKLK